MSDLTTKAKVKNILGITGTASDDLIDELITNITARIETYCNRSFTEASFTEYFDTESGDKKLFLRNTPVSSLTSVKYKTGNFGNPTYVAYNSNDYLLKDSRVVSFNLNLPEAEQFVQVVYTGGYKIDFDNEDNTSLHTLPHDLEQVATELVVFYYQNRQSEGVLSETTEGQSVTFKDIRITDKYKELLNPYRNINV